MVLGLFVLALILVLAYLPQLWVRSVIARHGVNRSDIAGTGAEFARHVLDGMGLTHVKVERTKLGDHYDPEDKVVRLLPAHHDGRSLSAVVIAAHEIGHAMQDATDYGPLRNRTKVARSAQKIQKFGSYVMFAAPLLLLLTKSPLGLVASLLVGGLIMGSTVFMHAFTLPVEFDASFKRALPLLKDGRLINERDLPAARNILRAAAFTYVAAAAMTLIDIARWFRLLRV